MFKFAKKWKDIEPAFEISLRKNVSRKNAFHLEFPENKPFVIQLPRAKIVSNGLVSTYKNELKYVDIEISNKNVCKFISEIEKKIISILCNRGDLFFDGVESGKKLDLFAVQDMFKYSLTWNNVLRLRVDLNQCQLFDSSGVKIEDLERVRTSDEVVCLIYSDYVKITNGIVKINWYLCQMKINKVISDCVIDDSDDNEVDEKNERGSESSDDYEKYGRFGFD